MLTTPVVFKGGIALIKAAAFVGVMSTSTIPAPMSDRIECWFGSPKPVVWRGIQAGQVITLPEIGTNGRIVCIGPKRGLRFPVTLLIANPDTAAP